MDTGRPIILSGATGPIGQGCSITTSSSKATRAISAAMRSMVSAGIPIWGHHLWAVNRLQVSLGENLEGRASPSAPGSVTAPVSWAESRPMGGRWPILSLSQQRAPASSRAKSPFSAAGASIINKAHLCNGRDSRHPLCPPGEVRYQRQHKSHPSRNNRKPFIGDGRVSVWIGSNRYKSGTVTSI